MADMLAGAGSFAAARRVAIVGLGLIGGSIACGLRARRPDIALIGVDWPDILALARRRHLIDDARASLADLADAEVVILATPVASIIDLIGLAGQARLPAVITDVGSTKRRILAAAEQSGLDRFVGGHPMAGAEHGGLDRARPDLFEGRPWFFTGGDAAAASEVRGLAATLGARPEPIDAVTHDRTMAYVSHLPQLLATALMFVAAEAVGETALRLSGPAFADMTRVAASSADVWQGILETNADFIAQAIASISGKLPTEAELRDPRWIADAFGTANRERARLFGSAS
jgi:prephenate dehydrogenase